MATIAPRQPLHQSDEGARGSAIARGWASSGAFVAAEAVIAVALAVVVAVFGPRHLSRRHDRISIPCNAGGRRHRSPGFLAIVVAVVAASGLVIASPAVAAQTSPAPVDTDTVDAFLAGQMSRHAFPDWRWRSSKVARSRTPGATGGPVPADP